MSTLPKPAIGGVAELHAHAIAIEKEAAERYAEFAARMADEGNDEVTRLCRQLAKGEAEQLDALLRRMEGCGLPPLPLAEYRWLDAGAAETAARAIFSRRHATPRTIPACARSRRRWRYRRTSTSAGCSS